MRGLAAGLALTAVLNALSSSPPPLRRPLELRPAADSAMEAAGLLSLGMRRLAADLGLVRMLIYYGTPEREEAGHEHDGHGHGGGFDPAHPELSYGGGHYPELDARARRILALDPSFSYPVIYAASAIAFNLNRPEEALRLLESGLEADPRNHQYRAYAAAIGFHRRGDAKRVLGVLEPALADPDCPTMIKSMVAFLYTRAGRRADALRLYRDILATSRDAGYRSTARRRLAELGG